MAGMEAVAVAVEEGDVDYAIVPIELPSHGLVHTVYDVFLKHPSLVIVGEVARAADLVLAARSPVPLAALKTLYGPAYAFDECAAFIAASLPETTLALAADTGAAAERAAAGGLREQQPDAVPLVDARGQESAVSGAALTTAAGAAAHGLCIVREGIAGRRDAVTRYWMLATAPANPEAYTRPQTSIVVTMRNASGFLFRAISCFAIRMTVPTRAVASDIAIVSIESRPSARSSPLTTLARPWEYVIYLDVEGTATDNRMQVCPAAFRRSQHALDNLREFSLNVRVLGSYQRTVMRT